MNTGSKFKDILDLGNYAVYGVLWQAIGTVRTTDLKTDAGYRTVVLPKYAVDALRLRKEWLRSQGYSDTEIEELPVVSAAHDPETMARPNDLSAFIRQLLSQLGCGKGYWNAVETTMLVEPDRNHDKTDLRDASAYVLRRNGCTLCCNVCGMDPELVDALMGHALPRSSKSTWTHYIRRPDNWPHIAEQMERVIYDPRHSANPAFLPITIKAGAEYCSHYGHASFALRNDAEEPLELEITVQSLEAGDSIVLESPLKGAKAAETPLPLEKCNAPIIGMVRERSDYDDLINQAEALDLGRYL